jgi:tagatose-6-phosphate ketose/aldose isomerase
VNPLHHILALPQKDKEQRGLLHTPEEIAQQPATWQNTWTLFQEHRSTLAQFLSRPYQEQWTIVLVGAGTSDYIGHAVAPLLRRQWNCEVVVAASTDLLTNREDLILADRNYLWISFSRSGESPEGVAVLEQALATCPNIMHLVVTCNSESQMASLAAKHTNAHAFVLGDAVNDRSLAMTSSFTNMVLVGQALAMLWSKDSFEAVLAPMARAAEFLLDKGAVLAEELARQSPERACFVGTGVLAATARESALKLLELTSGRIQTASESALGLRHGPMSALNLQTVFTSFISTQSNRCHYDLDLLSEIRTKQTVRTLVSVGVAKSSADHILFCDAFREIPDAYRAPVDVIFGQLFGLFASIESGLKPDSPSPNGIISRVVQKFTIYP